MDISSYLYECFVLRDFIIHSISLVVVHLCFILGQGSLEACSIKWLSIYIVIFILYQTIFAQSVDLFCDGHKIPVKSFSNSLLISDFFFYLQFLEPVFNFFFYFFMIMYDIPMWFFLLLEFRINLSYSILFAILITLDSILE